MYIFYQYKKVFAVLSYPPKLDSFHPRIPDLPFNMADIKVMKMHRLTPVMFFDVSTCIWRITVPKFLEIVVLRAKKVAMEKMAIINTFGPVLINGRCIGYMQTDDNWMNRTR